MQKHLSVIVILLLTLCLLSGCNMNFLAAETASAADDSESRHEDGSLYITSEEDARVKTLISDYFSSVYSEPVQSYYAYAAAGKVPEKIKGFVSAATIHMADGNREIGIHLPRFIETNGLVCIGYELIKEKSSNGAEVPGIKADFAGGYGGGFLYYTKVSLYAKCINASDFETFFTLNQADNTWKEIAGKSVNESLTDKIRIEARYDVLVRKEDGNYKLDFVKEAVAPSDAGSRLLLYNNDFIERLSYLDCSKTEDGKSYRKEEDGKVYEEEKAVIAAFFSSLKNSLDIENMKLLQTAWDKNTAYFKEFLGKVSREGDGDGKKFTDLIDVKDDYKTKFGYTSLPLQLNMERMDGELENIEIVPHPGYTARRKIYGVTFTVPVVKANGSIQGDECIYKYDYSVTLSRINETLKVDGIKLNEFSEAPTIS